MKGRGGASASSPQPCGPRPGPDGADRPASLGRGLAGAVVVVGSLRSPALLGEDGFSSARRLDARAR